jgi:hypothetical protein
MRRFWRMAHRLQPRAFVHYLLLTAYYPTAAIAWVLGSINAILYFTLGAGGVVVPAHIWLMLYVDAAALQIGLYFYNRRHNVSPHEKKGSAGVSGMLISALSAPIYAASLAAVALGRTRGFVTTPKGEARTRDSLVTFRKHLLWALVFGAPLALSFVTANGHLSMRAWSVASLAVCLTPLAIWRTELARRRREARVEQAAPAVAAEPQPVAPVPPEPVPLPVPEPVPLTPAARRFPDRRKSHKVVRFDRRRPLPVHPVELEPVRELRAERSKDHVIVHFEPREQAVNE